MKTSKLFYLDCTKYLTIKYKIIIKYPIKIYNRSIYTLIVIFEKITNIIFLKIKRYNSKLEDYKWEYFTKILEG